MLQLEEVEDPEVGPDEAEEGGRGGSGGGGAGCR